MGNIPEISIIVPVYKVGRYLRQCIDSILNQTFPDWECILVDDGSPDECGDICEEYAARDSRFHVIHRENGGLSAARNTGMEAARGKFVGFIDSDDWISPEHFATLHQLAVTHDADMVQTGYIDEYRSHSRRRPLTKHIRTLDRDGVMRALMMGEMPDYVWNKLYRRSMTGPDFPVGRVFEDIAVFNVWAPRIQSAVLAPDTTYHYRHRRGSILNSGWSAGRLDFLKIILERDRHFHAVVPDILTMRERCRWLWRITLCAAKEIARFEPDPVRRIGALRDIAEIVRDIPAPDITVLGPKKWWRARLLLSSPSRFASLLRLSYRADVQTHHRNDDLFP